MQTPCRGCKERTTDCHVNCKRYKKFLEDLDELHLKQKHEKDKFRVTNSFNSIKPK